MKKSLFLALTAVFAVPAVSWGFALSPTSGDKFHFQLFQPSPSNPNSARSGVNVATGNYNPGASLQPSTDIYYQQWFWARGTGESREYFPAFDQTGFGGGLINATKARVTYLEPVNGIGNVLEYTFTYELFVVSPTQSYVKIDWTCTNKKDAVQTVSFYPYFDFNDPSAVNQSGSYDPLTNTMTFTNGSGPICMARAIQTPLHYQISKQVDLREGSLADSNVTNLADSVYSGTADIAGAFQYEFTLAKNETASGTILEGYNYLPPSASAISGQITSVEGVDLAGQSVTVAIRNPGDLSTVESHVVTLGANGAYTFNTSLNGNYNVSVTGLSALRKANASVAITSGSNVSNLDFAVKLGDIDQDNTVTVFDYGVLSDYFDHSSADADWTTVGGNGFAPKAADIDLDGAVTVFDYGIISDNFDLNGDD